jgi:hypothetical protein
MHVCAMCDFETDDESAAYDHDCMKPTESRDSVETGEDIGGKTNAEAASMPHVHKVTEAHEWWADCFPQWKGQ